MSGGFGQSGGFVHQAQSFDRARGTSHVKLDFPEIALFKRKARELWHDVALLVPVDAFEIQRDGDR